nr:PREDICTED: single-strand selective monofunctional uracil DNA glycosylase [Tribolium castaneum]|eukprot:XP_971699.2 PREDICTED: single-strand selective monofunctional uracil DNA glycosylase [Tribolium castaneum]
MGLIEKVGSFRPLTMLKRKLSKPSLDNPLKIARADFAQKFLDIQLELNTALKPLRFKPPVAYVYNPVEYAFKANESYVRKYCQGPKKLLFLGMNPGPFGMCQTGVPFGEIKSVRDWLEIEEEVGKPEKECPQRPVLGFACTRSEVSGDRLWNVLKKLCGSPENFFKNCFIYNYCPIAMLRSDGGNLTPRDIKDTQVLEEICDRHYFKIIELLQPEIIIGIGEYAEKRSLATLKNNNSNIRVIRLPHPSPRSKNNQNWAEKAETFFKNHDLLKYMTDGAPTDQN